MSFWDEIKYSFKSSNNLKAIIYINLIVFVIVKLFSIIGLFMNNPEIDIIPWLAVPSNIKTLLFRPWTIITYMFTHERFFHLLFNLLVFFWFSKLFLMYLSQRQLLGVYILGGLAGALFYIVAFNIIPVFAPVKHESIAIGASASVMAIVLAVATMVPHQKVYMFFFGQVKLMYIAIAIVILDFIGILGGNAGGHIAHLGGALLGYLFVKRYRKGKDITIPVSRFLNAIKEFFKPSKKTKVTYTKNQKTQHKRPETDIEYNVRKKAEQDEIDRILDKIAKSGYSSLTSEEKEKLFKMSNKK